MRRTPLPVLAALFAVMLIGPFTQARQAAVDPSRLGPQVGSQAPPFSGVDQTGQSQSLESSRGPKGTMLVFFRSADW